jgi:DMSO/TMAO reductase YedYZ molybdopterin-dependent catalytic subunit
MGRLTRGFTRRESQPQRSWLPPGQYDVGDGWPVLTAEATPQLTTKDWTFTVDGEVERPRSWTWEQIRALPSSRYRGDIHCVTTWSKHDVDFGGVSLDVLLDAVSVRPTATHVLAFCHTGYTTNLPLDDVTGARAWVAFEYGGEPLPVAHGGPARLLVPHLYFWKSAKWVAGLHVLDQDEPGFWEQYGYHNHGDPWREERYRGD